MASERERTNSEAAARAESSPFSRHSLDAKSTRALPTTTASAERAAECAISGDDIPNPAATGSFEAARTRASLSANSAGSDFLAPVTPATVT